LYEGGEQVHTHTHIVHPVEAYIARGLFLVIAAAAATAAATVATSNYKLYVVTGVAVLACAAVWLVSYCSVAVFSLK
jgi:membrane protein YdbS with pleckstrin-like domain